MKKIFILLMLCVPILMNAQSFKPDRTKREFKDSVKFDKRPIYSTSTVIISGDTASLMAHYIHRTDTATMLAHYAKLITPSFSTSILITGNDTTVTAVKGKIVFRTADSSYYGCRSTVYRKKWYKLDN
jgi:hypothetical protein